MTTTSIVTKINDCFRRMDAEQKQMINAWASREHNGKITSLMYQPDLAPTIHENMEKGINQGDWSYFLPKDGTPPIPQGQAAPVAKAEPKAEPKPPVAPQQEEEEPSLESLMQQEEEEEEEEIVAPQKAAPKPRPTRAAADPITDMLAERVIERLREEGILDNRDSQSLMELIAETQLEQALRYLRTLDPEVARKAATKFLNQLKED